jgi:hypothetical protein
LILVRSARMRQCTAAITPSLGGINPPLRLIGLAGDLEQIPSKKPSEVGNTASWPCQAGSAQRRCIVARTRTDGLLTPPRTRRIRLLEFRSDHVTARSGICQKFVKPLGSVATTCLYDAPGCKEIHLAGDPRVPMAGNQPDIGNFFEQRRAGRSREASEDQATGSASSRSYYYTIGIILHFFDKPQTPRCQSPRKTPANFLTARGRIGSIIAARNALRNSIVHSLLGNRTRFL